jgi:hypothetical protein
VGTGFALDRGAFLVAHDLIAKPLTLRRIMRVPSGGNRAATLFGLPVRLAHTLPEEPTGE